MVKAQEPEPVHDPISVVVTQPLIYAPLLFPRPSMLLLDDLEIPLVVRVTSVVDGPLFVSRKLQSCHFQYIGRDGFGKRVGWLLDPPPPPPDAPRNTDDWVRLERGTSWTVQVHPAAGEIGVRAAGVYSMSLFLDCMVRLKTPEPSGPYDFAMLFSPRFDLTLGENPAPSLSYALTRAGILPPPPRFFVGQE